MLRPGELLIPKPSMTRLLEPLDLNLIAKQELEDDEEKI